MDASESRVTHAAIRTAPTLTWVTSSINSNARAISMAVDHAVGVATFGRGSVQTFFLHHPAHYGLANIFEIEMAKKAGGRIGFPENAAV